MSQLSKLTDSISPPSGAAISGTSSDVGSTYTLFDQTFAAGSTNVAATLAFVLANTQQLFLLADQPCTIKTNSSGSPADTKTMVAAAPLRWSRSAGYFTIPFTADVTSIFVSCTNTCRLQIAILTN